MYKIAKFASDLMELGDKLKEIYFSWEEKWYNFLDKADQHLPVYSVIDKVDNIVPSFALLLILIFIIFLLLIIGTFGLVFTQQSTLKLSIVDGAGRGVSTAQINIAGVEETYYSNDLGFVSDILLPSGHSIVITATKGDAEKKATIWLTEAIVNQTIVLPVDLISFDSRTIQFVNETGALITEELNLEFSCSTGANPPANKKVYSGVTSIEQPSDCGTLLMTVRSVEYETKNVSITNSSTTISLNRSIPTQTGKAIINLTSNGEAVTEQIRVSAYKANNAYIPIDTVTSINGVATFTIAVGDYIFETRTEQGYVSNKSNVVNVNTIADAQATIDIKKSVLGEINVVVKRGSILVEDALVTVRKETSAISSELTDSDGNINFQLGITGPFIINVTKDGYCEQSKTAELGDTVQINLTLDNGSCGGPLSIRVVDNSNKPVQYARAVIFAETSEDEYKLDYVTKTADFNGKASWNPVKYSTDGVKYKIFAYKGSYSGWSNPVEFTSFNQNEEIIVTIGLEDGIVNVIVKDRDNQAVQFAEVQLYEDYANTKVSGKRIVQDTSGVLTFTVRAGQRVYAVVQKEGYETYTTMPLQVIGNSNINFEVTLARPPIDEILVEFVGLYKNDKKVLKAQPGEEYTAVFELTAPKEYDELGFFVRVGDETVTKTEMDKIYIKELIVPGVHSGLKGASFNSPRGYNIDQDYLNLEESKWAQAVWSKFGYAVGKIRVGATIKIKQNARLEDIIEIGYRAWGTENGYERDPLDSVLGTTESNSNKQALYAMTKKAYAWIGTESLCETVGDNSFCVSATYTDADGIKSSFDSSFDAKNNSKYFLGIKVSNASLLNFQSTSTKLENSEENLLMGNYSLIAPNNNLTTGNINGYQTQWIALGDFRKDTEFAFNGLEVTPRQIGYGTLLLRLRNADTILYEKMFGVNIASDKKMKVEYLFDNKYTDKMQSLASGQLQNITLRAINVANGLEIDNASVKLFDRFGHKIYETTTNKLGLATVQIPASLPGELLKISVEKPEFETKTIEFNISEDIVTITPQNLSFTVNPQTKLEDSKTVKIENKTGFDLKIKKIEFSGKTKGLISTARMDSWFSNYVGKTIFSNDFEEIDFKVISAPVIPTAGDVEGKFLVTVGNDAYSWVQEVDAKIRVGLGSDVDNTNCLEITQTNWKTQTQGEEVEISFEIKNNCAVEGIFVSLKNLGAMVDPSANTTGKFSAQSVASYTELSRGFARTFKTIVNPNEVVPVTLKFTPYGGTTGTTSGTITFNATNPTDSTGQILSTSIDYSIDIVDSSCIVIGSDLIRIGEGETGSFSVTNGCTVEASFQIQSDLSISNKIFTLNAGESQDVTITRNEDDIPGAYNNLVQGRLGTGRQELIGNVKAILDPSADSCFTLSRYEFDIYDSPFSEFDGTDAGYLRNNCTQKSVGVEVSGDEGFDWDKVLRDMLVGGIAGLLTSGKLTPWDAKIKGWFDSDSNNLSEVNQEGHTKMKNQLKQEVVENIAEEEATNEQIIEEIEAVEEEIELELTELEGKPNDEARRVKLEEVQEELKVNKQALNRAGTEAQDLLRGNAANGEEIIGESRAVIEQETKKGSISRNELKQRGEETAEEVRQAVNQNVPEAEKNLQEAREAIPLTITKAKNLLNAGRIIPINNDNLTREQREFTLNPNESLENNFLTIASRTNDPTTVQSGSSTYEISQRETGAINVEGDSQPVGVQLARIKQTTGSTVNEYYSVYDSQGDYIGDLPANNSELIQNIKNGKKVTGTFELTRINSSGVNQASRFGFIDGEFGIQVATNPSPELGVTLLNPNPPTGVSTGTDLTPEEDDDLLGDLFAPTPTQEVSIKGTKVKIAQNDNLIPNKTTRLVWANDISAEQVILHTEGYTQYIWTKNKEGFYTKTHTKDRDDSGNFVNVPISGNFLLAQNNSGMFSGVNAGDILTANIINIGAGAMGGSALGGALWAGLLSILMGQDNTIEYSETFTVNLIDDISVSLQSDGGVGMSVGEVTYDYDQYYQNLTSRASTTSTVTNNPSTQTTGQNTTANNSSGQGLTQNQGTVFNPQALSATLGLVEIRELTFTSGGQNNPNPYEPFVGIITVTGKEKLYQTDYDYADIKEAAIEREEYEYEEGNFFEEIINPTTPPIAEITVDDLEVESTRNYEKKFRVLFNSYEYVECGPKTYPCAPGEVANCTVGSKSGATGPDAVPKMLLNWSWDGINISQCDETNPTYTYCDVTQATISTLKKIDYLKTFFNTNSLPNCPSAIDNLGTRSQSLNGNEIDVAITNIKMKKAGDNYQAEVTLRTNNSQELGATVKLQIQRDGTTILNLEETKRFTSDTTYTLQIPSTIGSGRFNVIATMDLDLCAGCQNNDTTNDSIISALLIGGSEIQECQSYDTKKDNFEKVLSANNINDSKILEYVNFNINLTRDSFSTDFKNDLDAYLMSFASAPPAYISNLRDLIRYDKFEIKWDNSPGAWRAGKYNARLIVDFNNESWTWNTQEDIKKVTLELEYWGDPVPYNPIYNVSFNGKIGLDTDNGRQGYGSNYNQLSEKAFTIIEGSNTVYATPNPTSNTPTRVNVSVDNSFYNMNFTRPGNVLTVQRIGEDVDLVLSPSIAIPVILDITRNDAIDAYAFYSVEVDGQPQTTGSRFMNWTGIGTGCVDHAGKSMTTWVNSPDTKNTSGDGYGLRWNNTIASGTSSFYSAFFVPQTSSVLLRMMQQSESATFITPQGSGPQIVVSTGEGVRSLNDVFNAIRDEEICVIGGEYFWNTGVIINQLDGEIKARENNCMTIS